MYLKVVLLLALGASQATALPNRTICSLPIWERNKSCRAAHAYHATSYFRSEFPLINWKAKYINVYPGSAADMVRGWVLNGGDCDAVIGPSTSSRAIAMSPLVEVMWLDPGATSTELSDKKNHPTFSRVIPTDEVLAKAAGQVYENFGWNATHILCTDEPYGRSVANGVSTAIRKNGGSVDLTICLEQTATGDRVADALDQFYASKTRIIYSVAQGEFLKAFQDECLRRNCSNDFIFFFAESYCPFWDSSHLWPGALCATFLVDQNKLSGFFDSYYNRDLTVERAEFTALGWPNTTTLIATDVYAQFAVDATHHAMSALTAYHLNNSYGNVIDFVRNHRSEGATGTIVLDSAGNRAAVDVVVYNTNSTGSWNAIATMRGGLFEYSDTQYNPVTTRPDILLRSTTYTSTDTLPSVEIRDGESSVTVVVDRTGLIVGLSVAGGLVLIILVMIAVVSLTRGGQRDISAAPKDQTKPFTLAFTDIQSSTSLWARIPTKMAEAVDLHHEMIRKLIKKHNGYEVKTIGDSFMVAFSDTKDAIEFAVGLQYEFFNCDWGHRAIDDVYQQLASEKEEAIAEASAMMTSVSASANASVNASVSANPNQVSASSLSPILFPVIPDAANGSQNNPQVLSLRPGTNNGNSQSLSASQLSRLTNDPAVWNGLRVRVGIHHGFGEVKFDEVTLGYDYYGTVVNTAARVEGVGNGGQVLITGSAYDDVTNGTHEVPIPHVAVSNLGPQPLRGLDAPVPLYQVLPAGLAKRDFPALRLDVERDAGDSDSTSMSESGTQIGGAPDANITPEILAERHARRIHGENITGRMEEYAQLLTNYHFYKALLATSTEKKKKELTDHCASKWRVPLKNSKDKKMTPKMQWERHVMQLVLKVTPAAREKLMKHQAGAKLHSHPLGVNHRVSQSWSSGGGDSLTPDQGPIPRSFMGASNSNYLSPKKPSPPAPPIHTQVSISAFTVGSRSSNSNSGGGGQVVQASRRVSSPVNPLGTGDSFFRESTEMIVSVNPDEGSVRGAPPRTQDNTPPPQPATEEETHHDVVASQDPVPGTVMESSL